MTTQNPEKVGEIYGTALYSIARELDMVEPIRQDLSAMGELISENADFAEVLRSPCFGTENRRQLLENVFGGRIAEPLLHMMLVANRHGRLYCLPSATEAFMKAWRTDAGRRRVAITVARSLTPDREQSLKDQMQELLKSEIDLEVAVVPSILGGVIIRYGDKMIDNSVLSRLNRAMAAVESYDTSAEAGTEVHR